MAYEQLATCYVEMKKPAEAIKCLESSRETLMQMAAKRGGMVGRMARIQALLRADRSRPVRHLRLGPRSIRGAQKIRRHGSV